MGDNTVYQWLLGAPAQTPKNGGEGEGWFPQTSNSTSFNLNKNNSNKTTKA